MCGLYDIRKCIGSVQLVPMISDYCGTISMLAYNIAASCLNRVVMTLCWLSNHFLSTFLECRLART